MNSLLLKEIIEQILEKEDITLSQLASNTKANRTHLSKLRNSKEDLPVTQNLINKISRRYPDYFAQNGQNRQDRIDKIQANLNEIKGYAIAILTEQEATQKVVLGSLERLEGKPEGALSDYADRLAIKIQESLKRINRGK